MMKKMEWDGKMRWGWKLSFEGVITLYEIGMTMAFIITKRRGEELKRKQTLYQLDEVFIHEIGNEFRT